MSVLVTIKIKGDTEKFQQALIERTDEFAQISDRSQEQGALHHRFGIGDGFVLIVDEWDSMTAFQSFFADPELQDFIASVGGSSTAPEITVTEAVSSADQF